MKFPVLLAGAALAFLTACGSDAAPTPDADPSATQPVGTSTAPSGGATTAPVVDPNSSFIALIDLATGDQITVYDGPGTWRAWFEAGGKAISALATAAGVPPRTVRIGVDGTPLADSATELQLRVNATGDARAYGGPTGDGFSFKTYLEFEGELVDLQGDPMALPLGFSPQGDRLLSFAAAPAPEGEAALTYTVHNLDGTVQSSFVNRLSAANPGSSPATWSPSGDYVATIGLDGLTLNDIRGGGSFLVPANGSTEWSRTEDALILVTSANQLQILRLPNLETTVLQVEVEGITASFDPSGRVVTVSDATDGITIVFDANSGDRIAEWHSVAEIANNLGFEPVIMTDDGLAAVLESASDCVGFLIIHPPLDGAGQCVAGRNPRWSPDTAAVSFTRGSDVIVLDIATLTQRTVASDLPTTLGGTLARWNDDGTHLLLEWPWGGASWTDSLP
jgi:hypothetical protein